MSHVICTCQLKRNEAVRSRVPFTRTGFLPHWNSIGKETLFPTRYPKSNSLKKSRAYLLADRLLGYLWRGTLHFEGVQNDDFGVRDLLSFSVVCVPSFICMSTWKPRDYQQQSFGVWTSYFLAENVLPKEVFPHLPCACGANVFPASLEDTIL